MHSKALKLLHTLKHKPLWAIALISTK